MLEFLKVQKQLRVDTETVERSFSAAFMFIALGLIFTFYRLEFDAFDLPTQVFGTFNILINIARAAVAQSLKRNKSLIPKRLPLLKNILALHSLNWGFLLALVFYKFNFDTVNPVILTLVTVGMCSGTPISLLTVPKVQKLFLFSSLLVPTLTLALRYYTGSGSSEQLRFAIIMVCAFMYFMSNANQLRKMFYKGLDHEFDLAAEKEHLKTILEKLQETKSALVVEQNKSANSERLAFLGVMAGGIAHEINNPLMVSSGHLSKIKKTLEQTSESQKYDLVFQSLKKISEMHLRMNKVIRNLQFFSNESEQSEFELCALPSMIEFSLGISSDKIKNLGINLEKQEVPNVNIQCQKNQLTQVFVHVLSNAIDAVKNSKEKTIRLRFQILNHRIRIFIADTGHGIPADIKDLIFNPFFTTKEVGEGTGLGLSVSRGIAKAHAGEVELYSQSGETVFSIDLPIADSQVAVQAA